MDIDIVPGTGNSIQNDASAYQKRAVALYPQTATAAVGTGTELDGSAYNRVDPDVALNVNVAIPARLVMASGHSVLVKRHIDHRAVGDVGWTPYEGGEPDDLTVTALNDGSAQVVDVGFGCDLSGAKEEIRLSLTPDFSASGVDTMAVAASFVFAGYDTNPPA